ncbi:MAG: hypothetical protein ACK5UP_10135 [Bacteroidota bacterium]|jgi:hypothetical protein
MSHRKQELNIPTDWEIKRNEFYDIDPFDNSSADDKDVLIFVQEDMLWIKKENYNIDLGWYGGHDLNDRLTGFCICLYRGDNWNKCELLEKFRTRSKKDIADKLRSIITSVDSGDYDSLTGYSIDEDDLTNENLMSDHEVYSSKK